MTASSAHEHSVAFRAICLWLGFFLLCTFIVTNTLLPHGTTFPFGWVDEQAHYSYVQHLIQQHRWWPDFMHFPLVDTVTRVPNAVPNYLNHPPTFYWLMKVVQITFPTLPPRIVPCCFYLLAIGLYFWHGYKLVPTKTATLLYTALPFLLCVYFWVGFYNNDSAAILGGMLATFASLDWLRNHRPRRACLLMLFGVSLASVKLTALLLVGLYVMAILLLTRSSWHEIPARGWIGAGGLMLLLSAPYLYFALYEGGFAPETLGHHYALTIKSAKEFGWPSLPRMDFLPWLWTFLKGFASLGIVLHEGSLPSFVVLKITILPLLMIICSCIFIPLLSPHALHSEAYRSFLKITQATAIATFLTLAIHVGFSWPRYQHYGWMIDNFIRYYFPLLAAYGTVCASAVMALFPSRKSVS
jgi:hypothetical protein